MGLRCFNALLLDLESLLYTCTCQTVADCNIVTHFAKRCLVLFVTVIFLHFVSVRTKSCMGQPRRKWYLSRKLKESVKCVSQTI